MVLGVVVSLSAGHGVPGVSISCAWGWVCIQNPKIAEGIRHMQAGEIIHKNAAWTHRGIR